MNRRNLLFLVLGLLVIISLFNINKLFFRPRGDEVLGVVDDSIVEVVATDLEIPWEIIFLSEKYDNEILVSERSGRIVRFDNNWERKGHIEILGIESRGEGGLLGIAIHPNFDVNGWLYLYLTSKVDDRLLNRIERYVYTEGNIDDKKIILDNIPGAIYHDGGRIIFGPDDLLYITTGDAREPDSAQDLSKLSGKILRLTDEGAIPKDNPFNTAVFSYGHRNPQGLTFDSSGNLWSTEHGRSGVLSGLDEINLIRKGENYGWPIAQGLDIEEGMISPSLQSGKEITWAPGDVLWFDDSLFFPGLRGESLYEVRINANNDVGETRAHFFKEFGRLRTVVLGPDGALYFSTSNRDGRGNVQEGDDKIIRVDPEFL